MNNLSRPLIWPVNWHDLSLMDRLFMGVPFLGTRARVAKKLNQQLICRGKSGQQSNLELFPRDLRDLAAKSIKIISKNIGWRTSNFIPSDPMEILLWDSTGDLATIETRQALEDEFGLIITDQDIQQTFEQFLNKILVKSRDRQNR